MRAICLILLGLLFALPILQLGVGRSDLAIPLFGGLAGGLFCGYVLAVKK